MCGKKITKKKKIKNSLYASLSEDRKWNLRGKRQKNKLALRFELRTNRFAICCATTAPYEHMLLLVFSHESCVLECFCEIAWVSRCIIYSTCNMLTIPAHRPSPWTLIIINGLLITPTGCRTGFRSLEWSKQRRCDALDNQVLDQQCGAGGGWRI